MSDSQRTDEQKSESRLLSDAASLIASTTGLTYFAGYSYQRELLTKLHVPFRSVYVEMELIASQGVPMLIGMFGGVLVVAGLAVFALNLVPTYVRSLKKSSAPPGQADATKEKDGARLSETLKEKIMVIAGMIAVLLVAIVMTSMFAQSMGTWAAERIKKGVCPYFEFISYNDHGVSGKHVACYIVDTKDGMWFLNWVQKSNSDCVSPRSLHVRRDQVGPLAEVVEVKKWKLCVNEK